MDKLLLDIPEAIETQRLKLQMPRAGFGTKLREAMIDGYDDYVKWLNWPQEIPSIKNVEKDCREKHAQFINREHISYIILEKISGEIVGKCWLPPLLAKWDTPQFGIAYFIRKTKRSNGYAAEATHALTKIAFEHIYAKKVEIYCDVRNKASNKIPIKLNFQLEYKTRGLWLTEDNELAELNVYSVFSPGQLADI